MSEKQRSRRRVSVQAAPKNATTRSQPKLSSDEVAADRRMVEVNGDIWAAIYRGDFRLSVRCERCGRWLTSGPSKKARMGAHCAAKRIRVNAKTTALLSFSGLLIDVLGFTSTNSSRSATAMSREAFTAVMSPADAIEAATQLPPNANCYFGVNPIAGPARRNAGRGAESAVIRLAALWVDVDVKPGACPNLDIAKAIIAELGIILGTKPSVIVESGGGLHAYWPVSDGGIHNGNMAVRGLLNPAGPVRQTAAGGQCAVVRCGKDCDEEERISFLECGDLIGKQLKRCRSVGCRLWLDPHAVPR